MNFIIILHSEYVKSRSGEGVGICQGELGHCGQVAYVIEGLAGQPRHFEGLLGIVVMATIILPRLQQGSHNYKMVPTTIKHEVRNQVVAIIPRMKRTSLLLVN